MVTLLGSGTAWAVDRYLIAQVEVSNASHLVAPSASAVAPATNGTWTQTSYSSSTAKITIKTVERGSGEDKIVSFVADVKVTNATIVRSAFAHDQFGKNITANTSDIASGVKAVLAINGDYCGFRDNGIIIRNGVAYRDKGTRQGMAFYADGTATLYDESQTSAAKLVQAGVWNTLSFGPGLVANGKIPSGVDSYEISDFGPRKPGMPGSIQGNQPRTGIGFIDKNHYVFIVVSGRGSDGSRGASMTEFAQMFLDAGANTAYNLDGGGSTTLVFGDRVVNTPAWVGGNQRGTSDILYVAG